MSDHLTLNLVELIFFSISNPNEASVMFNVSFQKIHIGCPYI